MRFHTLLRALCLVLLGLCLGRPLHAQLDPRLQVATTDLLDLFQQSQKAKVKPEILTVFDFSGSMQAQMYHAQYPNDYVNDDDTDYWMSFYLNPAGDPSKDSKRLTEVTAKSIWANSKSYSPKVECSLTLDYWGATQEGSATSKWVAKSMSLSGKTYNVWVRIAMVRYPLAVSTTTAKYNFSAKASYLVLKTSAGNPNEDTSLLTRGESLVPTGWSDSIDAIAWTFQYGSPTSANSRSDLTLPATPDAATPAPSASSAVSWTCPNYTYNLPVNPKLTVDCRLRTSNGYGNHEYSAASFLKLVKPDGSDVTEEDADSVSKALNSSYYGAYHGKYDVRNWVRAASHARFQCKWTPSGGSEITRTVDLPIPWKCMDITSIGNPLSSTLIPDPVVTRKNADGTSSSYGSGTSVEPDLSYTVAGGKYVLDGTEADRAIQTRLLSDTATGVYKRNYLNWIFKEGIYTDGQHKGKNLFIVYDAERPELVGGQARKEWGRGFGAFTGGNDLQTGEKITVPTYKLVPDPADTTKKSYILAFDKEIDVTARSRALPSRTRVQAVKEAAIRTWIKYQNSVFWAFRFLDPSGEGNSGRKTTINSDSRSTYASSDPATTQMYGSDSGWTLLNNTSAQSAKTGNSVEGMRRIALLFARGSTPLTYAMARGLAQFTDPDSVFNAVQTGMDKPVDCMNHFLILFTDGVDNNGASNVNANMKSPYLNEVAGATPDEWYAGSALQGNRTLLANAGADKTKLDRDGEWWNLFTFAGAAAHLADAGLKEDNNANFVPESGKDYLPAPTAYPTSDSNPSAFLPFAIDSRGTDAAKTKLTFNRDHLITTMTVGVSLGGKYNDSGSKRRLFLAAAMGDPLLKSWDISQLAPFDYEWDYTDPLRPRRKQKANTVCFFDATDPDKLMESLDVAIDAAAGRGGVNTAANPNVPFVGAALGRQVYLGKFEPPAGGGCLWPGDLLMFPTKEENGNTIILNKDGSPATTFDASTAQWSAAASLQATTGTGASEQDFRSWKDRKLWTLLPGAATLRSFTDLADSGSSTGTGLFSYVATAKKPDKVTDLYTKEERQAIIQFVAGGKTDGAKDGNGRPLRNRPWMMGDVINSAPAFLEYNWSQVKPLLAAKGFTRLSNFTDGKRFRLLLVGTNQGWLHAFGEVTRTVTKTYKVDGKDVTQEMVEGAVDELWSFMPTDFLANLDYLVQQSNSHRFMVDGSPAIYHLDLPPAIGGPGNGIFDIPESGAAKKERAVAIFGLRKGGRSYYALDLADPFKPELAWSLRPDDADQIPDSRRLCSTSLDTIKGIVGRMGYSSCSPALGRVLFGDKVKDAVFLGGGLSVPEMDTMFGVRLGRSVLALEAHTGKILAAVDLDTDTIKGSFDIGPVEAGVVPFEFVLNSGLAQRAYFLDGKGSLWAWGSGKLTALASYKDFRVDSSNLQEWTTTGAAGGPAGIRRVYRDPSGINAKYSTLPSPFRLGRFTGSPKPDSGTVVPPVVGVAMVSGDRNNPLDTYPDQDPPSGHRLTVVFDRQDSRAWGFDADAGSGTGIPHDDLVNFSGNKVTTDPKTLEEACADSVWKYLTPGCSSYFLAPFTKSGTMVTPARPKFGYYVNFPGAKEPANKAQAPLNKLQKFVPKGINTPLVLARTLFYSYFEPDSADVCSGGSGKSYAWSISDVLQPITEDARVTTSGKAKYNRPSGMVSWWTGLASDFFATGTRGVIQAGTKSVPRPDDASKTMTTLELRTASTANENRAPRARVWRTVY